MIFKKTCKKQGEHLYEKCKKKLWLKTNSSRFPFGSPSFYLLVKLFQNKKSRAIYTFKWKIKSACVYVNYELTFFKV